MRKRRFSYTGVSASLALPTLDVRYRGIGKPYYKPFTLHFGHTGELMECVVPKDDVLIFIPDGYEVYVRVPRRAVYIQGNPDGRNEGYEA